MPSKNMISLAITPTGMVGENPNPVPFNELPDYWKAQFEQGLELAYVTAPVPENPKQKRAIAKATNRCVFQGKRFNLNRISKTSPVYVGVVDPGIEMIMITRNGKVRDLKKIAQSKGERIQAPYSTRMLAGRLFPGVELAQVQVPLNMTEDEQLRVLNKMANLYFHGSLWRAVGGTGSTKNGHFIFCKAKWEKKLAHRMQFWPEAAIAYFGILVSECDLGIWEGEVRVRICADHEFGTNDSGAWVRQSILDEMQLPPGFLHQFRLLGAEAEADQELKIDVETRRGLTPSNFNCKGTIRGIGDEVCDHPEVQADFIVAESAIKPARKDLIGKTITCKVAFGIRSSSRKDSTTKGSYTVLQHASWDVIENEIMQQSIDEMNLLRSGFDTEEHEALLEAIGENDSETGFYRLFGSVLGSDRDGMMFRHPYIHSGVQKLLASWAYKTCTGGGMKMPGRMLNHDGYLIVEDGKLYSGSDWIPYDHCITDLPGERNLCVRFPVRMIEDLLPMKSLDYKKAVGMLVLRGVPFKAAKRIWDEQLMTEGTYILHADRAKTFGGDYDGDLVAVITSAKYPQFVDYRFYGVKEREQPKKTKPAKKLITPWMNLYTILFQTMGNKVGEITNLMSNAVANDRHEFDMDLTKQLQLEIDSLKHGTKSDPKVLKPIKEALRRAGWLDVDKKTRSIADMPMTVPVICEADVVARMYNGLRAKLQEIIGEANPLNHYTGLFLGTFDMERTSTPWDKMLVECRMMREFFSLAHIQISGYLQKRVDAITAIKAAIKKAKENGDKAAKNEGYELLKKAQADHEEATAYHKVMCGQIRDAVAAWGAGKPEAEKTAWAAALNHVISKRPDNPNGPPSKGAVLFHAFPQQVADAVSRKTGGEQVLADTWNGDYHVVVDTQTGILTKVFADSTRIPAFKRLSKQETIGDKVVTRYEWRRVRPADTLEANVDAEDYDDISDYDLAMAQI